MVSKTPLYQLPGKGLLWEEGCWMHVVLPAFFAGGLHIITPYCYHSRVPDHMVHNRALMLEVLGHIAGLGDAPWILAGDFNSDPQLFPLDLVHGGRVFRPSVGHLGTAAEGTN